MGINMRLHHGGNNSDDNNHGDNCNQHNYECDDFDHDINIEIDSCNPIEFDGRLSGDEIYRLLHQKVDKVHGKELSSNDFTDEYRNILAGLSAELAKLVPKTTKVNGKALTGDIVLTASDIGVAPTYREVFIMGDNQTTVVLQHTPLENKEVVCVNGLIAFPGIDFDYTLDGNEVVFNYPLSYGERIMVTYSA